MLTISKFSDIKAGKLFLIEIPNLFNIHLWNLHLGVIDIHASTLHCKNVYLVDKDIFFTLTDAVVSRRHPAYYAVAVLTKHGSGLLYRSFDYAVRSTGGLIEIKDLINDK